jgi:hypothetical protein
MFESENVLDGVTGSEGYRERENLDYPDASLDPS